MTTIDRIRVPWTGGRGGPGVSTFYALDGAAALAPLRTFFAYWTPLIVTGISWNFPGQGDTIVAETGVLSGTWAGTGQPVVVPTGGAANHSAATGAVVRWNTGAVLFGHRVVGRTFFVPGTKDLFDDGTINNAVLPDAGAAGNAMINAVPGNFVVWSRPFAGTPQWTDVHGRIHPAKAAHAGAVAPMVSATVPDLAVVLRSRRD